LDTPWDSEGLGGLVWVLETAIDEGATILNEVLDQNTPSNSPLLQRDDSTTDLLWCNFGLIDWDESGGHTDANTGDDSAGNEHADVDREALNESTNNPNDTGELDGVLSRPLVGNWRGDERSKEGSRRHGAGDTTLLE
jgi:hypothetical protein